MSAPKRILAVDYGDARTGLAATDWTGTICVPLERIDARDPAAVVAAIVALVAERQSEAVVVGMPLSAGGAGNARAQRTAQFQKLLTAALPCPVHAVDESHSTDEAHERLKAGGLKASQRKKLADSIAALVILERFRRQPR
ncbi:MAG: Holliday junction resolvase RuvX [Planctomycetes bacterium]|nr:Holliday junction resolvase RuvX [Planctomycetota bacterium]